MNWGSLVAVLLVLGFFDACDLTLVVDGAHLSAARADRDELRCLYAGGHWDRLNARCR